MAAVSTKVAPKNYDVTVRYDKRNFSKAFRKSILKNTIVCCDFANAQIAVKFFVLEAAG